MDAAALFAFLRDLHPGAGIVRAAIGPRVDPAATASVTVTITAHKPHVLIGKDGATYDALLVALQPQLGAVDVMIVQVASPELEPQLMVDDILKRISRAESAAEHDETARRLAGLRTEMAVRVGAIAAHIVVDGATIDGGRGVEAGGIADVGAGEIVVAEGTGRDHAGAVVTCTARVQKRRDP